jgi:tetratricopeptide (TPR) repeat protein
MTDTAIELRDWQRISGYLDQAFDLEPQARERWLDELASTQPEVTDVLRVLLAEREILNAEQFLEYSSVAAAAVEALQHASMAGKQVGAYTIDRLLGRGGMGEVWLASRSDGRFEGQCAIKFLSASAQPKLVERFRYEAGLLARLGHPNIARLLDAGATTDGRQFLVLEFVHGLHIDEYCAQNELPARARVRLFLDAVAAVAHAHSRLIVHRDLKPSNVLVTHDGTVKLLDFGIAKLLSPEHAPGEGAATRIEEIAITPEYAAPEQLLGAMTSTATDVYQLGMLLYVLLAGRHPLQLSGSRAKRIKAALNGKLPRASEFVARSRRKELRGDLDAILGRALNSNPEQRYPTAAAMRDDLVRYVNREPVIARRGTHLYSLARTIARHRVATVVSLLAIVSLCGMLIFALAQARTAARERDHALALAARNAAVTEFLGTLITEAAESDKPITVTEMLARSEKLALADTSDIPENRAAVLSMIGNRYMALGEFAAAERVYAKGLALLANSGANSLRSELGCQHASSLANLGQTEVAVRALQQEVEKLQDDPATAADCLLYRSSIAANVHDIGPALSYAKEALDRYHAATHVSTADEGNFLGAVGWGYHLNGQNLEADEYYRRALQKFAALGREGNADAITLLNDWALVVEGAGAPKRALEMYDRSLSLVNHHDQGATPPAQIVGNRGNALQQIGRLQEARAAYEAELRTGQQQQNLFSQLHALAALGSVSLALHEGAAAQQYLERMTAAFTPGIPAGSAPWRTRAILQGRVDMDAGRFDAARQQFTSALGNPRTALGINALRYKSESELLGGDAAAAAADARQALENARAMQGGLPYSYYTGLSWLALGKAQLELGQSAEAQRAFEQAVLQLSNTVDDNHPALLEAGSRITAGVPHNR